MSWLDKDMSTLLNSVYKHEKTRFRTHYTSRKVQTIHKNAKALTRIFLKKMQLCAKKIMD